MRSPFQCLRPIRRRGHVRDNGGVKFILCFPRSHVDLWVLWGRIIMLPWFYPRSASVLILLGLNWCLSHLLYHSSRVSNPPWHVATRSGWWQCRWVRSSILNDSPACLQLWQRGRGGLVVFCFISKGFHLQLPAFPAPPGHSHNRGYCQSSRTKNISAVWVYPPLAFDVAEVGLCQPQALLNCFWKIANRLVSVWVISINPKPICKSFKLSIGSDEKSGSFKTTLKIQSFLAFSGLL